MQLENDKKTISDLESREKTHIQHLSDLEQQLKYEREKNKTLLPLQEHNNEINNLKKNIEELTLQYEKLHIILSEKVKIFIKCSSLKICRKQIFLIIMLLGCEDRKFNE